MKTAKTLFLSAVIAAFTLPVASQAQSQDPSKGMTGVMNHGGELGVVDHNPAKSTKSRDQVKKELDAAHKDGTHEMGNDASTVKPAPATAGKSRQEVKKELANMTPEEKKALKEKSLGAK